MLLFFADLILKLTVWRECDKTNKIRFHFTTNALNFSSSFYHNRLLKTFKIALKQEKKFPFDKRFKLFSFF